jgi:membrane-bound lytic murein transglycosylase B/uncharacterized protein YoxC
MFTCKKTLVLFIFISALTLPNFIFGEENLAESCNLDKVEQNCQDLSVSDCRALLEKCENYYNEEAAKIEQDITKTKQEKTTLTNKINSLSKTIQNLGYQISQSNLMIKDLGLQIDDTKNSIEKTSLKIEDNKEKLSVILRTIGENDQKSFAEIFFTGETLSDFFNDAVALDVLNKKNEELLVSIKDLKQNLVQQQAALDEDKNNLEDTVKIQSLQKDKNNQTKAEQEYYLKFTEQEYQKQLKEKEETTKKAAEIRSRIFEIIGVAKAPTFGEAYDIAKYIESVTGIRPAFLLAILTQESNIGKNVGQCNLVDAKTGSGIRISNKAILAKVMNPKRDVPPFIGITTDLGRDPYSTPVSCPMSFGWGGAMGPAQFIPSTWNIYRDEIKSILGKPGDPWAIKDSFLAAALYLTDYGAAKKTENAEWRAALIYFSGSVNTQYRFYGDSVISMARKYEEDIKTLEQNR